MKLLDAAFASALITSSMLMLPAAAVAARPAKAAPQPEKVAPATPEQLAAAERVYYGTYECEFNQTAKVSTLPQYPGYVEVQSGKSTWMMKPVESHTGAIRLEEVKGRFLVVQIASKSMLLNTKTGQRVLDGCVCAEQRALSEKAAGAPAADKAPMLQ
jgi:hypothetical protein